MEQRIMVGGQAVIEGVMMRSPHAFSVAVRRPNGDIVIREAAWHSIWDRLKFLRWPFCRGSVVLLEALFNGISALTFSANEAARLEAPAGEKGEGPPPLSTLALWLTVAVSLALGLALFVGLPHLLTWGLGQWLGADLDVDSLAFHVIDGVIKLTIFVAYLAGIARIPEIKRVFMFHGAEHKSIYAYEAGEELTVANARKYSTLHPRCGTSFLIAVLLISILLFSVIFPYLPKVSAVGLVNQLANIAAKIFLMLPIAGLSYELIKWSAKHQHRRWSLLLSTPGLWMQQLTTAEPADDQLEVALVALQAALWREKAYGENGLLETRPALVIQHLEELPARLR